MADILGVHPIVLLSVDDLEKDELKLMVDMMSFMKKKHRDPAVLLVAFFCQLVFGGDVPLRW
jgi:hypothetical protein